MKRAQIKSNKNWHAQFVYMPWILNYEPEKMYIPQDVMICQCVDCGLVRRTTVRNVFAQTKKARFCIKCGNSPKNKSYNWRRPHKPKPIQENKLIGFRYDEIIGEVVRCRRQECKDPLPIAEPGPWCKSCTEKIERAKDRLAIVRER